MVGGIASERMDGGQTRVPAGRTVAPLGLEIVEEGQHVLRREVFEVEPGDRAAPMRREEAEQERQCIPIAAGGVGARTSNPR